MTTETARGQSYNAWDDDTVAVVVHNYPEGCSGLSVGIVDLSAWVTRYGLDEWRDDEFAHPFIMSNGDKEEPWDLEEEYGPCEWLSFDELKARLQKAGKI